ncbi:AbrB/MazE/SpoVT family DNA-binding domain-containing protein [Patescibacteria group bacterium]|nr:AbrB/MazE/SpoVT family DNA-binding domain-containing protein [Patescibacteria group bacterium]MCG2694829.1 AbrB/MazE/SpoVT family DNA-binding domain-containing protein [Candidatus Parcubacteria bacterium]
MDTTIRLQKRGIVTIPKKIRNLWKIKEGDFLNAKIRGNEIILCPSIIIEKEIINSSKKALKELQARMVGGPFSSMDEFEKFLAKK